VKTLDDYKAKAGYATVSNSKWRPTATGVSRFITIDQETGSEITRDSDPDLFKIIDQLRQAQKAARKREKDLRSKRKPRLRDPILTIRSKNKVRINLKIPSKQNGINNGSK
jgi:hypothetical protein